jgi:hypothetical protein
MSRREDCCQTPSARLFTLSAAGEASLDHPLHFTSIFLGFGAKIPLSTIVRKRDF